MVLIPFASFLAGAILSLVLPAGLLVAVVAWYHIAQKRIDPAERTPSGATAARPPAPANNPPHPNPPTSTS
jgi:predicted membrane metal-binding protein